MKWGGAGVFQVTTRKDHVARLVKAAILAGKVKPGERIVELELAQDLGIGNTAVREALFELQRQGFVTRQANRGTFVTELTREDAQQIFRVRRELEGLAAELVEGRLTETDERALRQLIEAMRKTAFERDLDAFSKADLDFHQTIWRLSRNRFLEEALLTMVGPLFAVFVMRDRSVSREELSRSAQRHRDILHALIRGSGSRSVMEDSLQYFLQQQMSMTFGSGPKDRQVEEEITGTISDPASAVTRV